MVRNKNIENKLVKFAAKAKRAFNKGSKENLYFGYDYKHTHSCVCFNFEKNICEVRMNHEWDYGCALHLNFKTLHDVVFIATSVAFSMTNEDVFNEYVESGREY